MSSGQRAPPSPAVDSGLAPGGLRPSPLTWRSCRPRATTGTHGSVVTSQPPHSPPPPQHLPPAPHGGAAPRGPTPRPLLPAATTGPGRTLKRACPPAPHHRLHLCRVHSAWTLFPGATEAALPRSPTAFILPEPTGSSRSSFSVVLQQHLAPLSATPPPRDPRAASLLVPPPSSRWLPSVSFSGFLLCRASRCRRAWAPVLGSPRLHPAVPGQLTLAGSLTTIQIHVAAPNLYF